MFYNVLIGDLFTILRRRILYLVLPFAILFPIAAGVIIKLPAKYMAQGTILVEGRKFTDDVFDPVVATAAEERLRILEKQVMARQNIIQVYEKYKVFPKASSMSTTEKVDQFRSQIDISVIDLVRRNRKRSDGVIAFTVGYEDRDPVRANRVTNELITLFLDLSKTIKTDDTSEAVTFLRQEKERLGTQLAGLEQKVASFKQQNSGSLPEHQNLHFQMLERAKQDISRIDSDIRKAEEEIRFYQVELSALEAGQSSASLEGVLSPKKEMADLQSKLARLLVTYTEAHPEVKSVRVRMAALQSTLETNERLTKLKEQINLLQIERAEIVSTAGNADPRIARIDTEISKLNEDMNGLPIDDPLIKRSVASSLAESRIRTEMASRTRLIASLNARRTDLSSEVADLEARIMATPQVASELASMERELRASLENFEQIDKKLREAETTILADENQLGEKYRLIEPPVVPEEPTSPNRPKLLLFAFALAGAFGFVVAFLKDLLFGTVFISGQVKAVAAGVPVIGVPLIESRAEKFQRRRQMIMTAIAAPVVTILLLTGVHFLVMPLEELTYKVMDRF